MKGYDVMFGGLFRKAHIKPTAVLVLIMAAQNCISADFNVICSGQNYSTTSISSTESNDGPETKTFRMVDHKINNMHNCPIANENQGMCTLQAKLPDGVTVFYVVTINRVSGEVEEVTTTETPRAVAIRDTPQLAPYLGGIAMLKVTRTFKGHCKKSNSNKF